MEDIFFFLHADGQSAQEIRAIDWSDNPLGNPDQWPVALRTAAQMMLASHFPKAIAWGPNFITLFNDAFRPILGAKQNCMGKPFSEIWSEVWSEIGPIAEKALQGEATYIEDFPLLIDRHGYPEQCYFTFCYSPIRHEYGGVGGLMDTVIESTGKVEAERNAAIFNAELAHRIKNNFSIVNAIASQTFADADSESLSAFSKRLSALSNAHDVLRLGKNANGSLIQIIRGVFSALGVEDRIHLSGPDLLIGPKGGASVSLLAHELTTNAMKYGALSNAAGHVEIRIEFTESENLDQLILHWDEKNGPQVEPPTKKGFGTKLIRMGLLGAGGVTSDFRKDGLIVSIQAPMAQIQEEGRHLAP